MEIWTTLLVLTPMSMSYPFCMTGNIMLHGIYRASILISAGTIGGVSTCPYVGPSDFLDTSAYLFGSDIRPDFLCATRTLPVFGAATFYNTEVDEQRLALSVISRHQCYLRHPAFFSRFFIGSQRISSRRIVRTFFLFLGFLMF